MHGCNEYSIQKAHNTQSEKFLATGSEKAWKKMKQLEAVFIYCQQEGKLRSTHAPESVPTEDSINECNKRYENDKRIHNNIESNMVSILDAVDSNKLNEFVEEAVLLRTEYSSMNSSLARRYGNYGNVPVCKEADSETWLLEKMREVVSRYLEKEPVGEMPESKISKTEGVEDWTKNTNITVWEPSKAKNNKVGYRAKLNPDFTALQCLNDLRADFLENVNYVYMSDKKYEYWTKKAGQASSTGNHSIRKAALECGMNKDVKSKKCRKILNSCKKDQRRLRNLYNSYKVNHID